MCYENIVIIFSLKNQIKLLQQENVQLKKLTSEQNKVLNSEELRFEGRFTQILSKLFTSTQIDLLLHPKKKVFKWKSEDIASAISLRSVSPKAYRFLLKKNFPLPGYQKINYISKWNI